MKYRKLAILAIAVLGAIFAGSKIVSTFDSGHNHDEHDHNQHNQEKSSQVTVWDDRFEIFMEHPFVVANKPTKFVTHVTDRTTLKPRRKGTVTFVLTDNDGISKRHVEKTPARDGIYIPRLTFPHSGIWNVSLNIAVEGKEYVVKLPAIKVYKSQAEVDLTPCPEEVAGVSFLKEQQWKLPFATEVVQQKKILSQTVMEAEHELHNDESIVQLSEEDMRRFGIEVDRAGSGEFEVHLSVPGEIAINTDRMAHIVPNAAGVVRRVLKNVGDTVKAGEVLAWLESSELGKAKVDYLTKLAEVGCCSMDLTRTKLVHDSTMKLLETLQSAPSVESLNQISGAALDKNHTTLISSYAELVLAKSTYQREKSLFEQEISSKQDYLAAENDFKKAEAKYAALRDSITFELQKNLIDAQRDQQVRLIGLKGAERSLYILGLTAEDINDVNLLGQGRTAASAQAEVCTDPNCTECAVPSSKGDKPALAKSSDENERLAWYPLRAPFDATVIDKHITLGEKLSGDSDAFTVADISIVWVNLNVHQKDLPLVKPGQHVRITVGSAIPKVDGMISYVSPIVAQSSRTTLARVVLDNTSGLLRPGTFVTADVFVDKVPAKIAVAKDILQDIDDRTCVFVKNEHGFEARPVTIGRSNERKVEIVSGLRAGETIVTKNSFRLKAELEKTAGGGHAGHGHAH